MASVTDNSTDRTRVWRQRKREGGAVHLQVTLLPDREGDELAMWRRIVFDQGGSPKGALLYLIRQEMGRATSELSDEDLLRLVRARMSRGEAPPMPMPVRPTPKKAQKTPGKSS